MTTRGGGQGDVLTTVATGLVEGRDRERKLDSWRASALSKHLSEGTIEIYC